MNDAPVTVDPVQTRADQRAFVRFAWNHYRGDSNWIPPLVTNQQELLNFRRHPFYDNAEIQTFLARRGGQLVGRIAAIIDHGHNQVHNEKRGMWGFFESVDDVKVSRALFSAVKAWHLERGMDRMRGPLNPAMNHECGLLVEGFHEPAKFLMPYNKPFYGQLVEDSGFFKSQDLYAFVGRKDMMSSLDPKLERIADQARERFGITVRGTDRKRLAGDVDEFLRVYNQALPGTWGFVPMTEAEARHTAKSLKLLIVHNLVRIAEFEGRVIGVAFVLLDFNPRIKQMDGRLFPFGFLRLLLGRKRIKNVRMISTNVVPEFQRWGVGMVLMKSLAQELLKWEFVEGEFSWVLESNLLSRQTLERGGARRTKTYRIYDWSPDIEGGPAGPATGGQKTKNG